MSSDVGSLNLTADELLSTTRAVRKRLDFDRPVPIDLIRECIALAIQAPSASLQQHWHFIVITDIDQRRRIAKIYRKVIDAYRATLLDEKRDAYAEAKGVEGRDFERIREAAFFHADNLDRAPAMLIPCIEGRPEPLQGDAAALAALYGSILPAFWSFMLAARARGLGTAWTTAHLVHERESAAVLGIDYDKITQVGMTTIAYTRGTGFKPGPRKRLESVLHLDRW